MDKGEIMITASEAIEDIEKALEWCATRQVDNQKNKSFSTRCHAGYFYVASCSFSL